MIQKGANDWNWGLRGACDNGNIEIVKGANDWNNGLISACYSNNIEIVELMLQKGANNIEYCLGISTDKLKSVFKNKMGS